MKNPLSFHQYMIWTSHNQSKKLKLSNGDLVEVSSDEEGSEGPGSVHGL